MDEVHRIINTIQTSTQSSVLATIIHVQGSAYRKEGTSMLFLEDGSRVGTLSAGCLEEDLALRSSTMMEKGTTELAVFDMRSEDDLSWGQGAGCNGIVYVLLERVGDERRLHFNTIQSCLAQYEPVVFVQRLNDDLKGLDYVFFTGDGRTFGTWQGEIPHSLLNSLRPVAVSRQQSGIRRVPECSGPVYIHQYLPKPRIIIFGAGPDAEPVVTFANKTGFTTIVSDWRETLCNHKNFPKADRLLVAFPQRAIEQLEFTAFDFIVIMTHHFQRDKEIVHKLKDKNLSFIGILGSQNRTQRLFGGQPIPAHIHSPVGLSIGAEGPEEIAVSIVAEVIKQVRMSGSKADVLS
jgi:xanthine dehydrogenase accessory factor